MYRYDWQTVSNIDVYSDTDWAGCPRTRRSTTGGALVLGSHLIKSWSSTQADVALSSGEAEYYGTVKAGGMGLGYRASCETSEWTSSSVCGPTRRPLSESAGEMG